MLDVRSALLTLLAMPPVQPISAPAETHPVTIEDLIRFSDAVVIGQVQRIEIIHRPPDEITTTPDALEHLGADVPFAEIAVSRVFKGSAELKKVIYLATPTWTCDVTKAVVGETALLFLADSSDDALFDPNLRRRVRATLPEGEWMTVMWDGWGRMPLRTTADVERVEWPMWVVEWPEDAPMGKFPRTDGSEFDRSVPLTWMEGKVRTCLEEQKAPWFTASVSDPRDGSLAWDLDVALDGQARLVIHEPGGDHESRFSVRPSRLPGITFDLHGACQRPPRRKIGSGSPVGGVRRLQVVSPEPVVDLRIFTIDEACMVRDERRFTRTLLSAWSQIRGLFDEPKCSDHRVTDAPLR